jgi:hypothetical protein
MNLTLSIDEQALACARKKAKAVGKSLNQLVRDYLQTLAGGDNPEQSIQEFQAVLWSGQLARLTFQSRSDPFLA